MIKGLLVCSMVMAGSLPAADAVIRPKICFITTLYDCYSDYTVAEDGWSPVRELLGSQSFSYKHARLRALMHDQRFKLCLAIRAMVAQVVQELMRECGADVEVEAKCQALLSQMHQCAEAQFADASEEDIMAAKSRDTLLFVDQ